MVLITFELANLLVLSYSQGTRALTGMAAGFFRGQNKTQLLWRRLPVTLPLYVRICVYKILSMLLYGLWHSLHSTTTSAWGNRIHNIPSLSACPGSYGKVSNGCEWLNLFIHFTKIRMYYGDWISLLQVALVTGHVFRTPAASQSVLFQGAWRHP